MYCGKHPTSADTLNGVPQRQRGTLSLLSDRALLPVSCSSVDAPVSADCSWRWCPSASLAVFVFRWSWPRLLVSDDSEGSVVDEFGSF